MIESASSTSRLQSIVDCRRSAIFASTAQHVRIAFLALAHFAFDHLHVLPLGILGRFAHALFVRRTVNKIFDYRLRMMTRLLGSGTASDDGAKAAAVAQEAK